MPCPRTLCWSEQFQNLILQRRTGQAGKGTTPLPSQRCSSYGTEESSRGYTTMNVGLSSDTRLCPQAGKSRALSTHVSAARTDSSREGWSCLQSAVACLSKCHQIWLLAKSQAGGEQHGAALCYRNSPIHPIPGQSISEAELVSPCRQPSSPTNSAPLQERAPHFLPQENKWRQMQNSFCMSSRVDLHGVSSA